MRMRRSLVLALLASTSLTARAGEPSLPDPAPWLEVSGASLVGVSQDGETVLFRMQRDGVAQLFRTGPAGGWPVRVTFRKEAVDLAALSPDGTRAVVGYDRDGDEDTGLYLVDVAGDSPGAERPLSAVPGVQHGDVVWSKEGDRVFFRSNEASRADFHLHEVRLADGRGVASGATPPSGASAPRRTVLARPGSWHVEDAEVGGKRLLVTHARSNYDRSLYVLDLATSALTEIDPRPAGAPAAAGDARFLGTTGRVLFLSERGGEYRRAWIANAAGEVVPFPRSRAHDEWDVDDAVPTSDGAVVYLFENVQGWSLLSRADVATDQVHLLPAAPGDEPPSKRARSFLAHGPATDAGGNLLFTESTPRTPGTVVRRDAGREGYAWLTRPEWGGLPASARPRDPDRVEFPSFDGRRIPAWLYPPPEGAPGPRAFVVNLHGGPEGQERPWFSAENAYLRTLGFGILAPNVRGSTGYGKSYRDLDNYKGRLDSVKDAKAAADWLVSSGHADPERIGVVGGSYGGYMVLACLTEYPDTFAAGVDVVGIANFETFLERTAPYRRALREAEYGPLSDREFLRSISPIHKVDRITAPLLIAHGEQDPRVPVGEARQIEKALKDLGRPVEALYFPDEGHGWQKKANRAVFLRKMAEFLSRRLKP